MTDMRQILADAVTSALDTLGLPVPPVQIERPARPEHGDWSTNVALVLARQVGRPPRDLAGDLAGTLGSMGVAHLDRVEIAGPGFVNFRLLPTWLHQLLADVVEAGVEHYATLDLGHRRRVQVEFVSANPTGPLHVGNGWLGSYGDAVGRLLQRCGWEVTREYYVNDTGGQIRALGSSILARRRGESVPEGGYQGDYVSELASQYGGPDTAYPADPSPDDIVDAGRWAAEKILAQIRSTLDRMGIEYDSWYSQASIEDGGAVADTIAIFEQKGLCYVDQGALMLRTTDFGDNRDRVLRKSDANGGDYTYLAGDLAYHRDKFLLRGFDRVIDVFGADHHGQVASLKAGVEALGIDPARLEIRLGQMVSLSDRGDAVMMSKRSGNFVPLHELVDELGPGVTRLLSLVSSIDQATTVDLSAVRSQSAESPVYYVQYAYARISAIHRVRAQRSIPLEDIGKVDLSLLTHKRELDLLNSLSQLPEVVAMAAHELAPHRVTAWARDFAGRFHGFYHDCRVMGDNIAPALTQARLWLVAAAGIGLEIGLGLLGLDAPEAMLSSDHPAAGADDHPPAGADGEVGDGREPDQLQDGASGPTCEVTEDAGPTRRPDLPGPGSQGSAE